MIVRSEFKSALVFFASGIGAGVFNYLFQVMAGRNLSAADFAALNGWFANLSLLFIAGGILQYASNFWPADRGLIRPLVLSVNVLTLGALVYWLMQPGILTVDRALIIVVLTSLFGWLSGQVQVRLAFGVLALAGGLIALSKFLFTFLPFASPNELDRYALALFAAYIPGLWIMSVFLWGAQPAQKPAVKPLWMAPILLSVTSTLIPQFDMVLMSHTLSEKQFEDFVRASLFFRALYFLLFILAQWLLPRQIQSGEGNLSRRIPLVVLVATVLSGIISAVSPLVSTWVMGWADSPPMTIVFASCVQLSLLALILLQIQEFCAKGKTRSAAGLLLLLAIEAVLQIVLKLPVEQYLTMAVSLESLVLLGLWFNSWRAGKC